MNLTTLVMIVVAFVALAMLAVAIPVALKVLLAVVPVALLLAALYSCLTSGKPTNIKLLWVIIIILAPILGPLLWFLWGRKNT